jgi:hypothetical protein
MSDFTNVEDVTNAFEFQVNDLLKSKIDKLDLSHKTIDSAIKPMSLEYDPSDSNLSTTSSTLLDSSDSKEKLNADIQDEPIKNTLSNLLDIYKDKYGYQITYEGFEEALEIAISSSKSSREIVKAIQSDLAATMSEVLIFKSIIVIGRVIDSQLNGIMSRDFTSSLNGETVSILNQMFTWIEKLEAIKSKYSQFDISQKIKDLNSVKSNVTQRTELELQLIEALRYGIDEAKNQT